MGRIGDFLIKQTKIKMDFHKRQASGQAVESLIERSTISRIQVYGVDYWENIDNGTPAGTLVSLTKLEKWISDKKARMGGNFPSAAVIQRRIYENGAPKDSNGLDITPKVLNENKNAIDEMVKNYVDTNIRQWQ